MKTFYITTPIYYANAAPHVGTLYTSLAADVIARFKRLDGYTVRFMTGTDEHGQKVEESAQRSNLEPQAFVDMMAKKFADLFEDMNLTHDDFIRTTENRHKRAAAALWNRLKERGYIYMGKYSGWYSVRDETYFSEAELIEGKAPTGADVKWISEDSYFFSMSRWKKHLLDLYKNNPDFIVPSWRCNEIVKIVESDLPDLSISRTNFKWGISVPGDSNHVMYVWFEALISYLASIGYPDISSQKFREFWPADVHIMGKDITKFHAIYWPAMLMAAELPLPKKIVSHGWWTLRGEKMSKSIRNVVDPRQLIENYCIDMVRYYLMREISFGEDGGFSEDAMLSRTNVELSNKIGNLLQRTLTLIYKNCDKHIPKFEDNEIKELYSTSAILQEATELLKKIKRELDDFHFNKALEIIVRFADALNIYINQNKPWTLCKTDKKEMKKVLYIITESMRYISILLLPFIPESANRLLDQISVSQNQRSFKHLRLEFALKDFEIDQPQAVFKKCCKLL